jgi:hypothetical protein
MPDHNGLTPRQGPNQSLNFAGDADNAGDVPFDARNLAVLKIVYGVKQNPHCPHHPQVWRMERTPNDQGLTAGAGHDAASQHGNALDHRHANPDRLLTISAGSLASSGRAVQPLYA